MPCDVMMTGGSSLVDAEGPFKLIRCRGCVQSHHCVSISCRRTLPHRWSPPRSCIEVAMSAGYPRARSSSDQRVRGGHARAPRPPRRKLHARHAGKLHSWVKLHQPYTLLAAAVSFRRLKQLCDASPAVRTSGCSGGRPESHGRTAGW